MTTCMSISPHCAPSIRTSFITADTLVYAEPAHELVTGVLAGSQLRQIHVLQPKSQSDLRQFALSGSVSQCASLHV